MDLNPNTLQFASRRIARYKPEVYQRDVLEPLSLDAVKFASVGISYLLHCVAGSIESKAIVFDHLKALMNPGGVLFGATFCKEAWRATVRHAASWRFTTVKACSRTDTMIWKT
jgi:hypothetical protein